MKILDQDGNELFTFDPNLGRTIADRILVKHHAAVEEVKEQWHYEVICEYPNGGKDVEVIIDVPGVEPKDAWDEYEDILRYIPYSDDELELFKKQKENSYEHRIAVLENALAMLLSGVVE